MGRGINNLWMNAAQFGGNMTAYMMDGLAGVADDVLDAKDMAQGMKHSSQQLDRYLKGAEELRRMAQEELASLELKHDTTWVDQMLVDSAGAAPVAGLAFSGSIGLVLLGTTDMGRQVATARQLAPEGDLGAQLGASIASGTVNTALNVYLGHLGQKVLSRSLQNFAKVRTSLPKQASILDKAKLYGGATGRSFTYTAGDFAQMHSTNKLMELGELGAQELGATLSNKASGIDWKAWGEHNKQMDTHLREALAMLPFVLIGSGKVALHHFRGAKTMLGEGGLLNAFGVDAEKRGLIVNTEDVNEQNTLLRQALQESPAWGSADFLSRATEVLKLLIDKDGKTVFKSSEEVKDFLELTPSVFQSTEIIAPPKVLNRTPDGRTVYKLSKSLYWEMLNLESILHQMGQWWNEQKYPNLTVSKGKNKLLRRIEYDQQDLEAINLLEIDEQSNLGLHEFLLPGQNITPRSNEFNRAFVQKKFESANKRPAEFMWMRHDLDSIFIEGTRHNQLLKHYEKANSELRVMTFENVMRLARGEKWETVRSDIGLALLDKMIDGFGYRVHKMFRTCKQSEPWYMDYMLSFRRGKSPVKPPINAYKVFDQFKELSPRNRANLPLHLKQFTRLMWGMQSDVRMLYEAISVGPEFKATRARGMTPKQALARILMSNLGISKKDIKKYSKFDFLNNEFPKQHLSLRLASPVVDRVLKQMKLVYPEVLESQLGDQELMCYRAKLPNGEYTFWHNTPEAVKLEYQSHLEDMFSPTDRLYSSFFPQANDDLSVENRTLNHMNRKISSDIVNETLFDELTQRTSLDLYRYYLQTTGVKAPGEYSYLQIRDNPISPDMYPALAQQLSSPERPFYELLTQSKIESAEHGRVISRMVMQVENLPFVIAFSRAKSMWSRFLTVNRQELPRMVSLLKSLDRLPRDFETKKGIYDQDVISKLGELSMDFLMAHHDSPLLPQNFGMWVRYSLAHPLNTPDLPQIYKKRLKQHLKKLNSLPEGGIIDALEWKKLFAMEQLQSLKESFQRSQGLIPRLQALPHAAQLQDYLAESVGINSYLIAERIWNNYYAAVDGYSLRNTEINRYDGLAQKENYVDRNTYLERMYHALRHGNLMEQISTEQRAYFAQRLMKYKSNSGKTEEPLVSGKSIYDSAVDRLDNLKAMLIKYPDMHFWGGSSHYRMSADYNNFKHLSRRDQSYGPKIVQSFPLSIKELGSSKYLGKDFKVKQWQNLPKEWQKDPLAVTAMRTLNHIRMHFSIKPVISVNGISKQGSLYSVDSPVRPTGLDESWKASHTLSKLFYIAPTWEQGLNLPVVLPLISNKQTAKERFKHSVEYRRDGEMDTVVRLLPGFIGSEVLEAVGPYCKTFYKGTYLKGRKGRRHFFTGAVSFVPLEIFAFREADYQEGLSRPFPSHKMVLKIAEGLSKLTPESSEWFPVISLMNYHEAVVSLYDYLNMEQVIQEKTPVQMDMDELLCLKFAIQLINDPDILTPRSLTRERDIESISKDATRFLEFYKKKVNEQ